MYAVGKVGDKHLEVSDSRSSEGSSLASVQFLVREAALGVVLIESLHTRLTLVIPDSHRRRVGLDLGVTHKWNDATTAAPFGSSHRPRRILASPRLSRSPQRPAGLDDTRR